jgi:hypothetical protein
MKTSFSAVLSSILLTGTLLGVPSLAQARDVIDDAFALCTTFERTGLTTDCQVKGGSASIEVTIDTNGQEARKICAGVVREVATVTRRFNGQWKLKILSPYSNGRAIAVCTLQ